MQQNELLKDKKVLAFPLNLGSATVDTHGNPAQYLMIKISTDEKTTGLRDDKKIGQVFVNNGRTGVGVATTVFKTNSKDIDPDLRLKYGNDVEKEQWRKLKGMQRLDKVIILPMPNEHRMGTNIAYQDDYVPSTLSKAGDIVNQVGNGVTSELVTLGKNAGISALVNRIPGVNASTADLLAEERMALNPKKEVMFKGIGFRQFSFQYSFAPKNELESRTVNEIIETLRYYSLPEISPAKFFYFFPSEFDISFMFGSKDNPNIPKITTCVLQRVGVNYSPNSGVWATLPNGAPVSIDLTLEFQELEIIDRTRVWNKTSPVSSGY